MVYFENSKTRLFFSKLKYIEIACFGTSEFQPHIFFQTRLRKKTQDFKNFVRKESDNTWLEQVFTNPQILQIMGRAVTLSITRKYSKYAQLTEPSSKLPQLGPSLLNYITETIKEFILCAHFHFLMVLLHSNSAISFYTHKIYPNWTFLINCYQPLNFIIIKLFFPN